MRCMQNVFWNSLLPTTIQHDKFRPVVEAICKQSKNLSVFTSNRNESPSENVKDTGDDHLLQRSYQRRRLYQRQSPNLEEHENPAADLLYNPRDTPRASQARLNVFESVTLIRDWSSGLPTTVDLAGILQSWSHIGGYDRSFDKFLLSDRLDVEFASDWGSLVDLCRCSDQGQLYRLTSLFAVLSFSGDVNMDVVRTLIAFAVSDWLKALDPPKWPSYSHFRDNHAPSADHLVQWMKPYCVPYPGDERSTLKLSLKQRKKFEQAELKHNEQVENDCKVFAQFLLEQWPCAEVTFERVVNPLLVDVFQCQKIIQPEWLRLFQNMELSLHIHQVQRVLDNIRTEKEFELPNNQVSNDATLSARDTGFPITLQSLLCKSGPSPPNKGSPVAVKRDSECINAKENDSPGKKDVCLPIISSLAKTANLSVSREIRELETIVRSTADSESTVRQQYGRDMMQSLESFKQLKRTPRQDEDPISMAKLSKEIYGARTDLRERFQQLCMALEQDDPRAKWSKGGGLWPSITPVTLLEQLRSTSTSVFGNHMKEILIAYAVSITTLQRLLRIEDAELKGNKQKLHDEQNNLGHFNWQPLEFPDWLLLEIDANILIRSDQVDVARATISPESGSNSVLQMNMGQGKTSVIMPMVATVLADAKKLLRIIVPKPLLSQTSHLLQNRLGSLLGRSVKHMPFSRKTSTSSSTTQTFFNIHKDTMASSGVIVALPEHLMSFALSGVQRLSDARIQEATQMIKIQTWMRRICRDVLDESDFTLAVRTQLIYPSGSQTTVDGHPHRWETAETLLRMVKGHLWTLQHIFPESIEVVDRASAQSAFPMVFFLRKDVEDALIVRLVSDIVKGQTSILPTREYTTSDRLTIKKFISEVRVQPAVAERIQKLFADKPSAKQKVYLLRGLLVHRILLLALKKRWNVQYGLHPGRDPIAVPYHAKGVPSNQAEWGHPDVAILFTCLSFYFGGLSLPQLRQSLENVVKSDDPSSEYDRWTQDAQDLPSSLREWSVINVRDETQLLEIWSHVRYTVVVVDYFLNNFVFPKHAKQFKTKLQESGWDLPSFSLNLQPTTTRESVSKYSQALTTGFSGTNDTRTILPLTIKQEDLRGLSHTNAEVMTYLLQARNRTYVLVADEHGRHVSELFLLHMLTRMKIRMLIDAGAQILEMDNLSLAKAWLRVDNEAPAVLYFDAENRPYVLYRYGARVPLLASPFADDLGDCLVYLDEAHTRGTDLKMPWNAKGALTLGLGQTKDHTVQAAMRLRQLATTQSVVFFAPPEAHQSILDLRQKKSKDSIDSYDVICWLLEQTCSGIEQLQPLYFSQGADFCRRTQAAIDNPDLLVDADQREAYLQALKQTEHQTLEQLYKPRLKSKSAMNGPFSPHIAAFMKELNIRRRGFQDFGNAVHGSALQEVEQEREVAYEVEAVRELQIPTYYTPLSFTGPHRDIVSFVKTGRLAAGSAGYEHAFKALGRTGLGLQYGINEEATTSKFLVSKEFRRTVNLTRANDNFLRQVHWILWSTLTETALVIIEEEAECLIPLIQDSEYSPTHLLTYAAPVTRKMLHFNDLGYYAIPALPAGWKPPTWLSIELGIFAGRLYFEFEEYRGICNFLGVEVDGAKLPNKADDAAAWSELFCEADVAADDTAVEVDSKGRQASTFTKRPLAFLQEWLAIKRKGQDFMHTPMGYVCEGKLLTESHPFFAKVENDGVAKPGTTYPTKVIGGKDTVVASDGDDIAHGDEYDEYDDWFDEGEDKDEDGMLDDDDDEKSVMDDEIDGLSAADDVADV
ncbi:hypothetical protein LTR16_000001 [Cryomyces antarcticus]|uniref:ubiquitinyl hydrolase 1 n=1 Tax=Cryomyces antarcticus TaxID=329879 RepID=A0ABR0KUY0_9PEZI|nr:hypothetical protein LTR39_000026 [Cryomyces antarcticus]KAK5021163.1 hypothetical protein LTR60_000100 [Cryomyces antarcticus]KAK5132122.1 hypothetical protein LTR16_000001 [Cryomyces antarcticus]